MRGHEFQQWIADSTVAGCPVRPSTLTLADFSHMEQAEIIVPFQPEGTESKFDQLGLPKPNNQWVNISLEERDPSVQQPTKDRFKNLWEGQAAPGVLMVDLIERTCGPHSSEIAQAFYQEHFPIRTLKHVFVFCVQNRVTKKLVTKDIYPRGLGVEWESEDGTTPRTWGYDTVEYKAILGTPIGKFVAALVLGAYARGTRGIFSITTNRFDNELQMRFDIRGFPPAAGPGGDGDQPASEQRQGKEQTKGQGQGKPQGQQQKQGQTHRQQHGQRRQPGQRQREQQQRE